MKRVIACAAFLAFILGASSALAVTYEVCARMNTAFSDSGTKEDFLTAGPDYQARYIRVSVTRDGFLIANKYADKRGCVSFDSTSSGPFDFKFWGDMRIPRSDNSSHSNLVKIRFANGGLPSWTRTFTFGSGQTTKTYTFSQTRRTNLIVASRKAIERFSDGLVDKVFDIFDAACPAVPDNSCNMGYDFPTRTANVYINPATGNDEKFLIAHELGHAVMAHWFNYNPGFGDMYAINDGGSACQWSAGHGLHSMEYSSAALTEGFAQYYATYAFNSAASTTGWFRYYKEEYKNDSVKWVNMEQGPDGGDTAYMENNCTGSLLGRGVELDWARQFWDYRTNGGTQPSNFAILRHIKNALDTSAWTNTNTFARMVAGIEEYDQDFGTDYRTRWLNTDGTNGINH